LKFDSYRLFCGIRYGEEKEVNMDTDFSGKGEAGSGVKVLLQVRIDFCGKGEAGSGVKVLLQVGSIL
jgi:hypothetical protein